MVANEDEVGGRGNELAGRKAYPALRKRGNSKNGRGDAPQIVVGLAVTRDGMPVRSRVFPGNTGDVTTVEKVKEDLRGWRLNRCVFVGDAGMNSGENRRRLSLGGGRDILATRMRAGDEVTTDVLTRAGRDQVVAEDLVLGYEELMRVEESWRTMKSGLRTRPVFHWTPHRICAHMSLCVLALLLERIAGRRAGDSWRNVLVCLDAIKVVEVERGGARVLQTTEIRPEAAKALRTMRITAPPRIHHVQAGPKPWQHDRHGRDPA